jgi:uridylate kinase
VYDKDPVVNSDAKRFKKISFDDVLSKNLRVMDLTAITLCKENILPIRVFNVNNHGDLKRLLSGEDIGTTVMD